jgi:hypothetical protein
VEAVARPRADAGYANPASWLCLPDRTDTCAADLSATELRADGSRRVEPSVPPPRHPQADCFYVYPTVDLTLVPGNHEDFSDVRLIAAATVAQAARFRETCALYVPLYRQATMGTFVGAPDQLEQRLAIAFSDIEAAFEQYLAVHDRGRPLVLLGHSQGAQMITRLVRRFFDHDPRMRARLLVALIIGGDVEVPRGRAVGATFDNVPLCTRVDETGCVVAYRSHEDGAPVSPGRNLPAAGNETACVNPADVTTPDRRPFAGAYVPINGRLRDIMRGLAGIETPFVDIPDFYAGRCVDRPDGYRYLAVSLMKRPGDVRKSPVDLGALPFRGLLGLHLVDYQLPQRDLLSIVARRVDEAARGRALVSP